MIFPHEFTKVLTRVAVMPGLDAFIDIGPQRLRKSKLIVFESCHHFNHCQHGRI